MSGRAWHDLRPDLVDEIRRDLAANFPSLHLFIERGTAQVRGSFPVFGENRRILDRFQVTITLPPQYPKSLPVTRETGGRIPWTSARHIDENGEACVLLPDERWKVYPVGAPLIDYLNGPLHSFFLSQIVVEAGGDWPFGEWAHGVDGILEHYYHLLRVSDPRTVLRYLRVLRRSKLKPHCRCPCGSDRTIGDCCFEEIQELRQKIEPGTAARSYNRVSEEMANSVLRSQLQIIAPSAADLVRLSGTPAGLSGK